MPASTAGVGPAAPLLEAPTVEELDDSTSDMAFFSAIVRHSKSLVRARAYQTAELLASDIIVNARECGPVQDLRMSRSHLLLSRAGVTCSKLCLGMNRFFASP